MTITITPSRLQGTVTAPPSKSYAHRLLIGAHLSGGRCEVRNVAHSNDMTATRRALAALSAPPGDVVIDCGESGTTARLLLPIAAHVRDGFTMIGSGRLPERPFAPLCREMRRHGCSVAGDHLPITVSGKLTSGDYAIEGNVSSQFISALLLTLPLLDGDSTLRILGTLESQPYVDITLDVLKQFGIVVSRTADGFVVRGRQRYIAPRDCTVEGDWSNAAAFYCMNALGNAITIDGLNPASRQGDKAIVRILDGMIHSNGTYTVDASDIPDAVPVIAATACGMRCDTIIVNASRLRLKESDRLQATRDMLTALGGEVEVTQDGLHIRGTGRLRGGTVDSCNDHRIVMAATVAACIADHPVTITDAGAIDKSYPTFFQDYNSIGGDARVVDSGQ